MSEKLRQIGTSTNACKSKNDKVPAYKLTEDLKIAYSKNIMYLRWVARPIPRMGAPNEHVGAACWVAQKKGDSPNRPYHLVAFFELILLGFIISLVFISNIHAQDEYIIGPSDVLLIDVFGEKDLSGNFTVSQDGAIKNILLGDVRVQGLTTLQVETLLTDELGKDYLVDPKVSVSIKEYRSHKVYVLGEIEKPGTYALTTKSRLLDILLKSGGPTTNAGDNVSILRNEGDTLTHIRVDITKLFVEGDLSQNILVKDGDIIYVSREEKGNITSRFYEKKLNVFYVVGEIKAPGSYELHEGYTVLNAILQAGGFTDYAKKNGVMLVRYENGEKKVYHLKMGDVMGKGDMSDDMHLQASDLIIVPESLF